MRLLNLLEYALISLQRRWKKQLSLFIIYTIVVGFFSSVIFFTTSLKQETSIVLDGIPELWVQKLAGGRLVPISSDFVDSLSHFRGVSEVVPRVWGYYFDTPTGAVLTITGNENLVEELTMLETLSSGPLKEGEALCGTGFMEIRELFLGDRFIIQDQYGELASFKIVGTFTASSDLLTKDLIVLSPQDARNIIGLEEDKVTDIGLRISNPAEVNNIARKIDMAYSGIRVVTKQQLKATYESLFSWRGSIFLFGGSMALFAFLILAWDRAAGLSAEEKKELGILKGIGWEISDVLWMKFAEGMVISFSATLMGIVLAYFHVFVMNAPLLKPFLIGWSVMYPEYHLLPYLTFADIFVILVLSIVPYLAATIIPAWRGAITDPADAF